MWKDFGLEQKPIIKFAPDLKAKGKNAWLLFTFDGATAYPTFEAARQGNIAYYTLNFDAILVVSDPATRIIQ